MQVQLPKPIANYFLADKGDSETIATCFTEDAVVKDEGKTYKGIDQIKQWKAAASKKYTYAIEILGCVEQNDLTVVTGRLTGNFPGNQIDLRYLFRIEADKIATLEIKV